MHAKSLQSSMTLWEPMDHMFSGFSRHRILQARVLEWTAISFSRGIFPTQGSFTSSALAGSFFTTTTTAKITTYGTTEKKVVRGQGVAHFCTPSSIRVIRGLNFKCIYPSHVNTLTLPYPGPDFRTGGLPRLKVQPSLTLLLL